MQKVADSSGKEITSKDIFEIFSAEYVEKTSPYELVSFDSQKVSGESDLERVSAIVKKDGVEHAINAEGNGPISAFVDGVRDTFGLEFRLADFGQNTRSATSKAEAAAYVELNIGNSSSVFGVGIDTSITKAPIKAVISALNRI